VEPFDNSQLPRRTVIQTESVSWLTEHAAEEHDSVITSLPDVSELSGLSLEDWTSWFTATVRLIIRWLPQDSVAIFFQSDVRRGARWVDKGYLVLSAAEQEGATLVWHKIVCRRPPGTIAIGRPSYSHMLCLAKNVGAVPVRPGPDVLADAGFMSFSRAMGVEACRVACQYLLDETQSKRVVDPFCGQGTVLAVANALGLDALGLELGGKRCRIARNFEVSFSSRSRPNGEPCSLIETKRNGPGT
jgi:hypothetical protein